MAKESAAKPFYSVLVLAFFCSLMVAGAAVGLKPMQEHNKLLDQKKNILLAAGLFSTSSSVDELFQNIEARIVELETGRFVPEDEIQPEDFNQLRSAMSSDMGRALSTDEDPAKIRFLEKYSFVYLAKEENEVKQVILPVRGKGLWSTMFGYLALASDFSTINGMSFYQHGETPGLGGEIENPQWLTGWKGKKIFDDEYQKKLLIGKRKGQIEDIHHIDGLSGATLTTNGVDDLVTFWLGNDGFKPFLENMKKSEG